MIKYVFMVLAIFIVILLVLQIVFFEFSKKRMDKQYSISWYETLNKPFQYTRAKRMIGLGGMAYVISSIGEPIDASWFLYMILFIAMGVVADAVVLYVTHLYAKNRCKEELKTLERIKEKLDVFENSRVLDQNYIVSEKTYNEYDIYSKYIHEDNHIAFLSVDDGEFVRNFHTNASIVYDVEPMGDCQKIQESMNDEKVKVLSLASENRLPFKEEKIDTLICRNVQFDKKEIIRVLKQNGYFIVFQNGSSHLKEFINLYAPIGLKVIWDSYTCANHLQEAGMTIVDKVDYFGTIRFSSIESLYTYFDKTAKEFTDIEKYKQLYLSALYDIDKNGYYELSTHEFIVVSRK